MNTVLARTRLVEPSESRKRKRLISFLSALGVVDFSIISLYQLGIIKKLPDLPFKIFDSNKVNASKEARIFGVPDGPISLVGYVATIVFAAGGEGASPRKVKFSNYALAATVLASAAGAAYYLNDMVRNQKKACIYCLIGAAINFAMVPLVYKELKGKV